MKLKCAAVFIVFLLAIIAGVYFLHSPPNTANTLGLDSFEDARFPIVHIELPNSPFYFYDRNNWQSGTISFSNAPEGQNFEPVATRVRGRGHSTWRVGPEKRPLRFRLYEPQSILGANYEARDWILIADRFDRSFMRNYSALYLSRLLNNIYAVEMVQHVHLFVNGEYMGVYLFTDERTVQPGRLEIAFHPDPARSGFFIELDSRATREGIENVTFINPFQPHSIRYPFANDRTPAHMEYLLNYFTAVNNAIRAQDFELITQLIDLDSFIDFYLVLELYKCPDSGTNSNFMYITGEGDERRLFKGPPWDFDLTAGNMGSLPSTAGIYAAMENVWFRYLLDIPEFRAAVAARWFEIRHNEVEQMLAQIRHMKTTYYAEFEMDFLRHPDAPTPPFLCVNLHAINYFQGQVDFLLNWLDNRINWLDNYFAGAFPDYCHMQNFINRALAHPGINVTYLGALLDLNIHPILLHNVLQIELIEMAQIFNLEISHQGDNITMRRGNIEIIHRLETNIFHVNGTLVTSVAPSNEISGVIYIPIRVIAESLGYDVEWDRINFYVNITEIPNGDKNE
ncbi:MAG: CotH kinase family protein [Defluviitaleaceae bacterium]|nr:CotH kinase family protein [Defluviitaleaceae bacterium]